MQLKTLINQAIIKLSGGDTAALDARILLQYVLSITPEIFYLKPELEISESEAANYWKLIERRVNKEPVAKIIGVKPFWSSDFIVNQHTLDPRPDSEVIIEEALKLLPDKNAHYKFLDLGSGSGCLLLSLLQEFPNAIGIAGDISSDALSVVKQNIALLGLQNRAFYVQQNWADAMNTKFDLIVSNPPYIPSADISSLADEVRIYDPMLALDGGEDGLDPYRYLSQQISPLLKEESYAILEFGCSQSNAIKEIFLKDGYHVNKILFDLSAIERAIVVSFT